MYELNSERFSFAHRHNDNGSVDSICQCCFRTIAHRATEPDLQNAENSHVCNSATVEHCHGFRKAVSDYRGDNDRCVPRY